MARQRITYKALTEKVDEWNKFYGLEHGDLGLLVVTNNGNVHELCQVLRQDSSALRNLHLSDRNGSVRSCYEAIDGLSNPWNERPMEGVFTVGNEAVYDRGLAEHGSDFKKLGRRGDYPGGYAFQSVDAARWLIAREGNDWAVYKLDAQWDTDTAQSPNGWWHALLRSRRILKKIPKSLGETTTTKRPA